MSGTITLTRRSGFQLRPRPYKVWIDGVATLVIVASACAMYGPASSTASSQPLCGARVDMTGSTPGISAIGNDGSAHRINDWASRFVRSSRAVASPPTAPSTAGTHPAVPAVGRFGRSMVRECLLVPVAASRSEPPESNRPDICAKHAGYGPGAREVTSDARAGTIAWPGGH